MKRRFLFSLVFPFLFLFEAAAQVTPVREDYVRKYAPLALRYQKEYGIPAGITLAQGLLESDAGRSELARKGNNHFGIKCNGWKGGRTIGYKGDCYRRYASAEDSYADHASFLKDRPRYAALFKLKMSDYKGWAKGLQKAGYATDHAYAKHLIKLVEEYGLDSYTEGKSPAFAVAPEAKGTPAAAALQIYKERGLEFVYARPGDDLESLARDASTSLEKLQKYNEMPEGYSLKAGEIVYLRAKKRKADKPNYEHVVKAGESLHDIAQQYGIRLKSLYKLNHKQPDYVPAV
ncbi:MAG: glucosaminidase domain-containing protein, partial [Tannerella sp.]|nr:glucosaminidase domain-containing protein [Tannerella sp.]